MKIHIAEDVKIVRDAIVRHVDWTALGLEVTGVSEDGEQALERIGDDVPDLLVADIGMPVMDGIELIRCVKERCPDVKCIILTGLSEFNYAQEAIKLGVFDYVLKPIDFVELTEAIRRAVKAIREERAYREQVTRAQEIVRAHLPNVAGGKPLQELAGHLKHHKFAERMLEYIKANLDNRALSLQQVAGHVQLSEKYANSIFKDITGTTINSFIIAQKMELAAKLLANPDTKVYEVCDKLGYSDQDYFRDSFKKHHGCTPTEYRNRYL